MKITISCFFFLAWREGLSDQDKKNIAFAKELIENMDAYVKEDPQHQSMAKTGMSEKQQLSAEFLPWDILLFSLLCHKHERLTLKGLCHALLRHFRMLKYVFTSTGTAFS